MKYFESVDVLGDLFRRKRFVEDVRIVRISPQSYWMGQTTGFYSGVATGFTAGLMFMGLALGIFL